MAQAIPLAQQLRRQLVWIGLALSIGCLLLMAVFATLLEEIGNTQLMQLEARTISEYAQRHPQQPLPQAGTIKAWRSWEEIPVDIRQHFDHEALKKGQLLNFDQTQANENSRYIELIYYPSDQGNGPALYVASVYQGAEAERLFADITSTAVQQILGFTLVIMFSLLIVILWLFHRALAPLKLLSRWATALNDAPNQAIDINFPITELNEIADQLRQGVAKVRRSNEREQQFLKHASHELRTPLAVIQASLDTLQYQVAADSPVLRPVERAQKASRRMIQLSDTLLWLARESDKTIPRSPVALLPLCQHLLEDHRYLLRGRPISTQLQVCDTCINIEAPLLSIVLANLVRNACQHSGVTESGLGEIHIQLDEQQLQISNPVNPEQLSGEQSFGLGLELVQRICQKLGWAFSFELSNQQAQVCIHFQPSS
ncbi:MAG: HAMP domain-containing histidine kinase [Marinobacterium sp.]|nr:HAMP domain-containing histidine kinase [Marinobacterium sp.]